MKLTRRAILGSAAVTALAQTQPAPATPDEELKAARERIKTNSETLAKLAVPIETEPALQFKA